MSLHPASLAPAPHPRRRGWREIPRGLWAQPWPIRVFMGIILAVVLAFLAQSLWSISHRANPLLVTPALALEQVQAKSLYYNGLAWAWLHEKRPELLREDERTAKSERVRAFTQAVQNPKLFRQLDRQSRFDTLILVGDPSQYRPLLEHLLETRDWSLEYVDHLTLIFQRGGAGKWSGAFDATLAKVASWPKRDRAIFLAQTARKLIAVREPAAARRLLDQVESLDPKVSDLWSVRAQYHLARGEWRECEAAANRALELDKGDLSAMGAKAQALYSTKRFQEAYALSRRLTAQLPDEPGMLFYHAKIAHAARAFSEEARALRHLIGIAEANERPASGYRVYLGQSLATAGEGAAALEEFQKAIADPELPKEQREFARECMALVKAQVGGATPPGPASGK